MDAITSDKSGQNDQQPAAAIEEAAQDRQAKKDALNFMRDKLDGVYNVLDYLTDDLGFWAEEAIPKEARHKIKAGLQQICEGGSALFDARKLIEKALGEGDGEEVSESPRAH